MQAIFSFMGAHPETMQRNLAAFSLVPLDVNFRSPKYLLDLYRDYAAQNLKQEVNWIPNKAETAGRDGLVYWVLEDDEHEGIFLARELIPSMLNKQSGRISILTKSNAKAIDYSESLYHQGIDHFIVTQVDLFRTRAAKDFMAFLQTLSRPHGRLSWVRLLSAATGIPLGASFEIVNDCFKSGILPHWLLKGCGADLYYPPIEMTHIAMNHRLVVLDTETTGLDLATSDIIQFAAVEIIQGRIGKSINIFLKTCQDVGASEAVHHITKSRLDADGVERREAFRMILEFIQDSPIAAHNMDFDMAMLDSNIARSLGVSFRGERVAYCSLEVSIALDPDLPKHKLGCLIERYQLEGQNTHDALDDVRATAELILHYVAMARDKYVDAERFHTRHRRYCEKLREVFGGVWSIVRDDTQKSVSFQDLFEIFKGLNCSRPYESKHFADIERKLIRHMNEYTKPTYLRLLLEQELERYMLFREPDLILETDRVVVSTIHRAKGLEFEMVIIPDCHSNNYPSYFAKTPQKNDEEARLLFVAITRAIRSLVVLQPKVYTTMKGNRMSVKASPFLGKLLGYFDYNDRTGTQQQVVTRVKHICGNCGRTWSWDGSRERDNRCFGCGFVLM
jgi:DNA helicase-2/ATP-dependent DNA helicase PcrA